MTRHIVLVVVLSFTVTAAAEARPAPHLTAYSPTPTASPNAQLLTISGSSFVQGMTVSIGTVSSIAGNRFTLTVILPVAGYALLSVRNPDGKQSNTLTITVTGVTVQPPPPLFVTCPASMTIASTTGTSIPVVYQTPVASGGVAPLNVVGLPQSGSTFVIGTTLVNVAVTDAVQQRVTCQFTVTVTSTPPPPTSLGRGPQAAILCPPGAINVSPGTHIQTAVDAAPAGSTFCLRAGVFTITSSTLPKSGDTFVGEYGAVLDGSTWVTGDPTQAAFRAHNEDVDNVTIRNLVIQNMPQQGIHGSGLAPSADGWTVDHCELAHNGSGVQIGNASTISNNFIHHNVAKPGAINPGAYSIHASDVQLLNNEISYNASETKFGDCRRLTIRGNYFHHQEYNALWLDGHNDDSIIEGNTFEDTPIFSIFLEISRRIVVRTNTIRRAGWAAIALHTSHDIEVAGNLIDSPVNGVQGITLRIECGRQDATLDYDLANNSIHDNVIKGNYSFDSTGMLIDQSLGTCSADYASNVKANKWSGNTYVVSNTGAPIFAWGVLPATPRTFLAWQGLGQDLTGMVSQ